MLHVVYEIFHRPADIWTGNGISMIFSGRRRETFRSGVPRLAAGGIAKW
jgi:hypothetical protein